MKVLACTGVPELEKDIGRYCVIRSVALVDDVPKAAEQWNPDVVLFSVYLPSIRLNALEACRELRRLGIRTVVMCGNNIDVARAFFEVGMHEFIMGERVTVFRILERLKYPMSLAEASKMFRGSVQRVEKMDAGYADKDASEGNVNGTCSPQDKLARENNIYTEESNIYFTEQEPGRGAKNAAFVVMQAEEQEKDQEKEKDYYKGPPVLGFWGPKPGSGVSSIARAAALLASDYFKVLFVETDFRYPSAMFSLRMVDTEKCLDRAIQTAQEDTGGISQFVLNRKNCKSKVDIPDGFNLLAPSIERGLELFPKVESEKTIAKIHESLKDSCDLVIYDIASEVDSYLNIGAMKLCSHLIVVLDGNPAVMAFVEKRMNLLRRLKIKAVDGCVAVTNKLFEELAPQRIQQLIDLRVLHNIPYDREMSAAVMNMQPGGRVFMKSVENLCALIGLVRNKPMPQKQARSPLSWRRLKGSDGGKWALDQLLSTTQ